MIDCIKIYYAQIPDKPLNITINKARRDYVDSFKDEFAKAQRYWASVLLDKALADCDIDGKTCKLELTESGKWICDGAKFSISHSKNLIAVSVSSINHGVDVEFFDPNRFNFKLAQRIMTDTEKLLPPNDFTPEKVIELWTKKESIFKLGVDKKSISDILVEAYLTKTYAINLAGDKYVLSCATDNKSATFCKPQLIDLSK